MFHFFSTLSEMLNVRQSIFTEWYCVRKEIKDRKRNEGRKKMQDKR